MEDGVPNDNNNQSSCKTGVQGKLSLRNDEVLPPRLNPETILTTQAEPGIIIYLIFDLETTRLSRLKYDIIEMASIMIYHEGIRVKVSSFKFLLKPQDQIPLFTL